LNVTVEFAVILRRNINCSVNINIIIYLFIYLVDKSSVAEKGGYKRVLKCVLRNITVIELFQIIIIILFFYCYIHKLNYCWDVANAIK